MDAQKLTSLLILRVAIIKGNTTFSLRSHELLGMSIF